MAVNRAKHGRTRFAPPKFEDPPSDSQKQIYLEELATNVSVKEARKAAGWSRKQLEEAMKDPAFVAALGDVEAHLDTCCKFEIYRKAIHEGNTESLKMIGQSKLASEFGTRSKVEVSFTDKRIRTLTLEETEALLEQHDGK